MGSPELWMKKRFGLSDSYLASSMISLEYLQKRFDRNFAKNSIIFTKSYCLVEYRCTNKYLSFEFSFNIICP
jgi:hypothetical protein